MRLPPGLKVGATLSDSANDGSLLGAALEDGWTWDQARQSILKQRQREDPEKTYGLSPRAAQIIVWILDLHDGEFELGMTPCLEDVAREQIGIDDLSYSQNSEALLTLLIEAINEKTSYALRLIPWRHCDSIYHRILVRRDSGGDEELVRKIQIRGLDKGVNLTSSQVEKVLAQLWETGSSDA